MILENFVGFAFEGCHESNLGNKAVSFLSLKIVFATIIFSFIITMEIAVSLIELNVLGKDKILVDIPDDLDEKEQRIFHLSLVLILLLVNLVLGMSCFLRVLPVMQKEQNLLEQ